MKPIAAIKNKGRGTVARLLILGLALLAAGCASDIQIKQAAPPTGIESVLVLPFKDIHALYEEEATIRSPLSGNTVVPGEVAEYAARVMTDRLLMLLRSKQGLTLIPPGQGEGVMALLLSQDKSEVPERDLLVEAARALNADSVMAGFIYRFEPRIGSGYAVKRPAYVVFDLYLIRAADGEIVWGGYYEEMQRSLSENLFKLKTFIQRGGKWVTAEEMALSALEDMFASFPLD